MDDETGNETERKPWDRMDGEPSMWYARMDKYYRPQGPERSIEEAYRLWLQDPTTRKRKHPAPRPNKYWHYNARDWKWRERVAAWDAEQRRKRLVAEERERAAMLERHIRLAQVMQTLGGRRIQALLQEMNEGNTEGLGVEEARLYLKDGVSLERQARGMPEHLLQIMQMSDDELLAYIAQFENGSGEAGGSVGAGADAGLEPIADHLDE